MPDHRWLIYALASAVAAAFVGILAKFGMREVDPTFATLVRSVVMTLFLLAYALISGAAYKFGQVGGRPLALIALSGVAGALSWLFYFRALQLSAVSKVAPIDKLSMPLAIVLAVLILGERPSGLNWLGIGLIGAGAYLAVLSKAH